MAVNGELVVRIVEDDESVAEMLRVYLTHERAKVLVTTTDFGLMLTPDPWEDVDVAVVDFMLPELSGDVILRYLADVHPTIRRILFTAVGRLGIVDDSYADAVITKPASPAEVWEAVRGC